MAYCGGGGSRRGAGGSGRGRGGDGGRSFICPSPPPPRHTAPQTASTPAAPAASSSAPSPAALAKEVEKELFVSETALAPGLAHPARPGLATVGKLMIRSNHFLVNLADNNLFHYVSYPSSFPSPPSCTSIFSVPCICMVDLVVLVCV